MPATTGGGAAAIARRCLHLRAQSARTNAPLRASRASLERLRPTAMAATAALAARGPAFCCAHVRWGFHELAA